MKVQRFVEKPNAEIAQQYLAEGAYYWNAVMFVLKTSVWLNAMPAFRLDNASATSCTGDGKAQDKTLVSSCNAEITYSLSESSDYAVMERCPDSDFTIKTGPRSVRWSYLGARGAVWRILPKDDQSNAHFVDMLTTNNRNTLMRASNRLVGLENPIFPETPDSALVAERRRSQPVNYIATQQQATKRYEYSLHRRVRLLWRWYGSKSEGGRFKVKLGASFSLQKLRRRAEQWIVVKVTAEIENGGKVPLLTENLVTYIPLGFVHCLVNSGTAPLDIIGVHSGSHLAEDDILRFEDSYERN